jgi:pyruvate dehydrogenase E1 component
MGDHSSQNRIDLDPDREETEEWRSALLSMLAAAGPQRVREIMDMLAHLAMAPAIDWKAPRGTVPG